MLVGSYLSLVVSRVLGRVVVDIHGPLDASTVHELGDRLVDIIETQGHRQLVLDLRGMTHIDDAGLAVLVDALECMRRNGGELVLSGPTSGMTQVFRDAGLDQAFMMTPSWTHPARGRPTPTRIRPAGWGQPD
jgi:anti-sigma B factor antagonist/stage II sporulation protein AA (anti-sigma F factor antagonist)